MDVQSSCSRVARTRPRSQPTRDNYVLSDWCALAQAVFAAYCRLQVQKLLKLQGWRLASVKEPAERLSTVALLGAHDSLVTLDWLTHHKPGLPRQSSSCYPTPQPLSPASAAC